MSITKPPVSQINLLLNASSFFSKGVATCSASCTILAILPSSVSIPVTVVTM